MYSMLLPVHNQPRGIPWRESFSNNIIPQFYEHGNTDKLGHDSCFDSAIILTVYSTFTCTNQIYSDYTP